MVEETASGLAYAFAQGVTHRDMKLTNILMSSDKTAKLVDFGLAQIYTSMGGVEIDKVDRTVDYAGLEKATGVKRGDVRSDIYFLGCVLYQLLTGHSPLAMTRSARARMEKHRFDDVKPMSPLEVDAPDLRLLARGNDDVAGRRSPLPDPIATAGRRQGGTPRRRGQKRWSQFYRRQPLLVRRGKRRRLQDVFREKFKEYGYRVLIAGDPGRAADRFRQQPFDALIVNLETVGEDGIPVFEHIMVEAQRKNLPCAGIVLLGQGQADLQSVIRPRPSTAILIHPVKIKQLQQADAVDASQRRPLNCSRSSAACGLAWGVRKVFRAPR